MCPGDFDKMDQYRDECHAKLVKIASKYKLPKRILSLEISKEGLEKLSSRNFAYPEARLFPINTPEDTLLSAVYFLEKEASLPYEDDILGNITSAAIAHGVEKDLVNILSEVKASSMYKEASGSEYAYSEGNLYPINSVEELSKSASSFVRDIASFNIAERKNISKALIKKADYYELDLDYPELYTYCSERDVDLKKAAEYMLFRAKRTSDQILKEAMVKVTQGMLTQNSGVTDFEKVAQFIDNYDSATGIDRLVRKGTLPDGYRTIFNKDFSLEKSASVTLAGTKFSEEDFKSLPVEKFAEALGNDFIKASQDRGGNFSVDQAMNIAATLPLGDAEVLSEYLKGNS